MGQKLFYHGPMNSHQKSVGKIFRSSSAFTLFLLGSLSLGWVTSCAPLQNRAASGAANSEVSLTSDQKAVEDLRKNVPPEKRKENDELAIILSLMGEIKLEPSTIREKYDRLMRKRREDFRRTQQKEREVYSREERKRREEFLATQKKERDAFKARKADREATQNFFAEQELKRKDFFANEREKRSEFESSSREKNNDFNANMREWQQTFTQELRVYSQRHREWKKANQEKLKSGLNSASPAAKAPMTQSPSSSSSGGPPLPPQFTEPPSEDGSDQ